MTARPTVTIITPVLNRAGMMPAALESLAAQACPSLEHIVVDGGSTDGTQQLAADAGAQVIEAPGTSIYEALNIGLGAASGDLVGLLNSDDVYAPAAVARARAAFAQDGALEIVRGRAATELFADGRWQTSDPTPGPDPALTLDSVLFGASNINACFFRPSLIARVGLFDTNYPISADREWLMRAILAGAPAGAIHDTLYVYRAHPGSLTIGGNKSAASAWIIEHQAFAKAALARAGLSAASKSAVRAFLAKEIAHLATLHLGQGRPQHAAAALARGFGADPLWPLHALSPLSKIAARRLVPRPPGVHSSAASAGSSRSTSENARKT